MELDKSEREDEVMVLQEIYGDKHFKYDKLESKGTIECEVELNGSTLKFGVSSFRKEDSEKSEEGNVKFSGALSYIPSISLEFRLPIDYPSTSMPQFCIYCMWISPSQVQVLEEKLKGLWDANKGSVILFIWTTFLQNEVLTLFDLGKEVVIQEDEISSLFKNPTNWIRELEEYDRSRKEDVFNQSIFSCHVCFQDKQGKDCLCFQGCDHVYCKICMKAYFETKVKEGTEAGIVCPTDKCTTVALPKQIKDLISDDLYSKFEKGMIEMSLRDMMDVVRCPLRHCQVPTIIDLKSNSTQCSSCGFVFCNNCLATFHGLNPCKIPLVKQREILNKYNSSDEMGRKQMEKTYGLRFIQEVENVILSHDLIKCISMNCPYCSSPIMKSEGCNKMTCSKCATNFCYICGERLSASNPYIHFSDPKSPCANLLFDFLDQFEYDEH